MAGNADIRAAQEFERLLNRHQHGEYRRQVGEFLYLAVYTRPDISFAVGALARGLHAPTIRHKDMVRRVLRYLSGTRKQTMSFKANPTPVRLESYTDADWASCTSTRQSTTGQVIMANGTPVSWRSTRQSIGTLSSTESEYVALSTTGREVAWLCRLYAEIGQGGPLRACKAPRSTPLFTDSTGAIALSK